jgi:hypothetical protein
MQVTRKVREIRDETCMMTLLVVVGLCGLTPVQGRADSGESLHPIEVRNPESLGTVDTGMRDASGASIGVECATCHDLGHPDALARKNEVPEDFHGGIEVTHGSLSCGSCHEPEDRTRLRLADGRTLPIRDVLQLCGQCHGPKYRDFSKGSHGGGRGYWDRSKGPWIRNNCVACHAAHAPAYPLVMPAAPPNDRFLARDAPAAARAEESGP